MSRTDNPQGPVTPARTPDTTGSSVGATKETEYTENKPASTVEDLKIQAEKTLSIATANTAREARTMFADLPSDTLIINHITLENVPATAISIEIQEDIFIAETLRTSSPIVHPEGGTIETVTISLSFSEGDEQSDTLRKLMASLLFCPYIFVENKRIREALFPSNNTDTMIFVLHSGSLQASQDIPGVVILNLQLARFNYKPFSNHFWYNAYLPGTFEIESKNVVANKVPENKLDAASSHDFNQQKSSVNTTVGSVLPQLFSTANIPTVFPVNSRAWMYFVDKLTEDEMKFPISDVNSDYLGFTWKEYQLLNPPSKETRASYRGVSDYFNSGSNTRPIAPYYDASQQQKTGGEQEKGTTSTAIVRTGLSEKQLRTAAEAYALSTTVTTQGGGNLKQALFLGKRFPNEQNSYRMTDLDRLWSARLLMGEYWDSNGVKSNLHYSVMLWSMMNRFVTIGFNSSWSFGRFLIAYSEPLHRGSWMAGATDKKSANRKKAQTFIWSQIPDKIRNFVNSFAAGNVPKPRFDCEVFKDGKKTKANISIERYTDFAEPTWMIKNNKFDNFDIGSAPPAIFDGNCYVKCKVSFDPDQIKALPNRGDICDSEIIVSQTDPSAVLIKPENKPVAPAAKTDKKAEAEKAAAEAKKKTEEVDKQAKEIEARENSQEEEEARRMANITARRQWIEEIEKANILTHYKLDPAFRNVFFSTNKIHIGGAINNSYSLPDITISAITTQFGHRFSQLKLLGQDSPVYQFLGAGNRSGTIVFSAANAEGRGSLEQIKAMVSSVRQNARLFSGIKDAGSIELSLSDLDTRGVNNVLALINARNIVVTNVSEQTSNREGVDISSLVLEFVVQEFTDDSPAYEYGISFSNKMAIIRTLLGYLQTDKQDPSWENLNLWDSIEEDLWSKIDWLASSQESSSDRKKDFARSDAKLDIQTLLGQLRRLHTVSIVRTGPLAKVDDNHWFAKLVEETKTVILNAAYEFPVMDTPVTGAEPVMSWEGKIANDLGPNTPSLLGGSGVSIRPRGPKVKGFIYYGDGEEANTSASREAAQEYKKLLTELNRIVVLAMQHVTDPKEFETFFKGDIYKDIVKPVSDQSIACYRDLKLPQIPGFEIYFPPDFYLFDDSLESAQLAYYNDPANLERMIESNITNQIRSINRIAVQSLLGGKYVSANMDIIKKTKINLNELFKSEIGYTDLFNKNEIGPKSSTTGNSGWEGMTNNIFASSARTRSIAFEEGLDYVAGYPYLSIFTNKADSKMQGTEQAKALDGFLNSMLEMSPYLTQFASNPEIAKLTPGDKEKLIGNLKSHLYYSPSSQASKDGILFGPNKEESNLDAVLRGDMSISDIDLSEQSKESSSDIAPGDKKTGTTDNKIAPPPPPAAMEEPVKLFAKAAAGIALGSIKSGINMRRVYPTFKIYFIEEDSQQGTKRYRAFDDFYSSSSIQEIRVIRSRKIAADLAIIRMTNVAGILYRRRFDRTELSDLGLRDGNVVVTEQDIDKAQSDDPIGIKAETEQETPFSKLVLQDGVKVQIRLGYNSDPDLLETVFLGQIVEIQPTDKARILEIVIQGYGAELEAAKCGDAEDGAVFFSAQQALSAAILQPFVTSFGHRDLNQLYNPAEVRSQFTGGLGEDLFEFNALDRAAQIYAMEALKKYTFLNLPQDDNIFAPPVSLYLNNWDTFWNNAGRYRPINVSPWEIFKEHELRHPGYVSLAVPYGHSTRMTMFFGARGQNYWASPVTEAEKQLATLWTKEIQKLGYTSFVETGMLDRGKALEIQKANPDLYKALGASLQRGNEKSIGFYLGRTFGRYRPFRNYHMFTSEHHIISNEIRTSITDTWNAVEVRYSNSDEIAGDGRNWTQRAWDLVAKGKAPAELTETARKNNLAARLDKVDAAEDGVCTIKLNDNIPDNLVRKQTVVYPSCITEYMAMRYAQGTMIQGLKDTYKGDLVVLGDPTIKPYDVCQLQDNVTDMMGPFEVEQVIHVFNRENGFISIVTPDLCVDFNEWVSKGFFDSITSAMSLMWMTTDDASRTKLMQDLPLGGTKMLGRINSMLGATLTMYWDQTGSPYMITPLSLGGRPFLSITVAPAYSSSILNIAGNWSQWWEDLDAGLNLTDISESMLELGADAMEVIGSFFNAGQNPN